MPNVQVPWYNDKNRMGNLFNPSGISRSRRGRSMRRSRSRPRSSRARSSSGRSSSGRSSSGRSSSGRSLRRSRNSGRSRSRAIPRGTSRGNRVLPRSINTPINSQLFRQTRSSPQKIQSNLFTNSQTPLSLQSNNLLNVDLMMKISEQQKEIESMKERLYYIENWMIKVNNEID